MALFQVNYFSQALMRLTTFHMFLPNDFSEEMVKENPCYDRPPKMLLLLHGYSGNTFDWMLGSLAQALSLKYNLVMILPSGENSFYLNGKGTGRAYGQFVGEELPIYVAKTFSLSVEKENVYAGGYSMGGFGAIHTALAYPNRFQAAFALSPALVTDSLSDMKPGEHNGMADYEYYTAVFGNLKELDISENNPKVLLEKNRQEGRKNPPIYMACGTEDFLLETNRDFAAFLKEKGADYVYQEGPGIHDWNFWNRFLEPAVQWMLEVK